MKLQFQMGGLVLFAAVAGGLGAKAETVAAFESGETLLARCANMPPKGSPVDMGLCVGYVSAIADAHGYPLSIGGHRVCFPKRAINRQEILDVVVKWLRENPRERQHAAPYVVTRALAASFPCVGSQ